MLSDAQRINSAGTHLLSVVNDLLDISKIEAGRMTVELSTFEVQQVVEEVRVTVQPMADRNANTLTIETPDEPLMMHTDASKLRQVLINLLSNACKFTERGPVVLRSRQVNESGHEWIQFAVSDTGIGIAKDDMPKLFHDFSQLDASFTRRYGGTGLGLAICHRFVVLLGGGITVQSELGRGSTFTVRLPITVNDPKITDSLFSST
jgi:signal transduction histidine kinase